MILQCLQNYIGNQNYDGTPIQVQSIGECKIIFIFIHLLVETWSYSLQAWVGTDGICVDSRFPTSYVFAEIFIFMMFYIQYEAFVTCSMQD